jgi:hypothetical protein
MQRIEEEIGALCLFGRGSGFCADGEGGNAGPNGDGVDGGGSEQEGCCDGGCGEHVDRWL